MLNRFRHNQAALLDRYWNALTRGRAERPAGIDPEQARFTEQLIEASARLDAEAGFASDLGRRLEAQAAATIQQNRREWAGPTVGPNSHRPASSRAIKEHEEQQIMSEIDLSHPRHEPAPIQQRRWAREALKLAAAAIIFITIGAILALTLRDDDDTPAVVSPGPTPTPSGAPSSTTTAAPTPSPTVMAQVASPTAAPAASPAATEAVPTPMVMSPPAADLPLAGQISAAVPVGVSPLAIAAGHGSIWVYNDIDGTLSRIDPGTGAVVATIQIATPLEYSLSDLLVDRGSGPDLAIDADSVWAINPEEQAVVRIDPLTNAVVATIPLESKAVSIAVDGSSLWVSLFGASSVARIDTTTNEVVAIIPDVPSPAGIAVYDDAVWVANYWYDTVTRIDPQTNEVVAKVSVTWTGAPVTGTEILADEHGVWVALEIGMENAIARIDPDTNRLAAIIPVGGIPRSLASDARGVWVGLSSTAGVLLIDPDSNQVVAAVPATEAPNQLPKIAVWEDTIWAARPPTNDVARIDLQPE